MNQEKNICISEETLEKMITAISEVAWSSEMKGVPQNELYESYVEESGEVRKEVKEEYAGIFFSLRSAYKLLVMSYVEEE